MIQFVYTCPTWLDSKTDFVIKISCSPVNEQIIWTVASNPRFEWSYMFVSISLSWHMKCLGSFMWSWTSYTNMSQLCLTRECLSVIGTNCSKEEPWARNSHETVHETWQQKLHESFKRPKADLMCAVLFLHIWWSPNLYFFVCTAYSMSHQHWPDPPLTCCNLCRRVRTDKSPIQGNRDVRVRQRACVPR